MLPVPSFCRRSRDAEGVWEDLRDLALGRRISAVATGQRNYLDVRWGLMVGRIVECRCMDVGVVDCARRMGLRSCWSMAA